MTVAYFQFFTVAEQYVPFVTLATSQLVQCQVEISGFAGVTSRSRHIRFAETIPGNLENAIEVSSRKRPENDPMPANIQVIHAPKMSQIMHQKFIHTELENVMHKYL